MSAFAHLRNARASRVTASGPYAHLLGGAHQHAYEAAIADAEADRTARQTAAEILAAGAQARGETE